MISMKLKKGNGLVGYKNKKKMALEKISRGANTTYEEKTRRGVGIEEE